MNWVTLSLLMFVFSVVYCLLIKKSQLLKTPNVLNNLATFAIPSILFLIFGILNGDNFILSLKEYSFIFLISFFFSYMGNKLSLESVQLAPNPGYSYAISTSYVIFTLLLSVVLFGSAISLRGLIAIIIVIASIIVIVFERKEDVQKKRNKKWITYAVVTFFALGFLSLSNKHLLNLGVHPHVILFYITFTVSVIITIEAILKNELSTFHTPLLLMIGIVSMFYNLFQIFAYKYAPNPGYVSAISASSISVVTILSAYFYKDTLTMRKIVGVLGTIVGLIFILM